jgi:hypothetical protein
MDRQQTVEARTAAVRQSMLHSQGRWKMLYGSMAVCCTFLAFLGARSVPTLLERSPVYQPSAAARRPDLAHTADNDRGRREAVKPTATSIFTFGNKQLKDTDHAKRMERFAPDREKS